MRLVVCVNHAAPFHIGGSEKVVQQVTETMTADYGMECVVIAKWADREIVHNGVRIMPYAATDSGFIDQLRSLQPDHTMVYSDSFLRWPVLTRHAQVIPGTKSVVLVGMNHMRNHGDTLTSFKKNLDQFTVITHSNDYIDYLTCESMGIPVTVIPNAIDFNEFQDQGFSFREKYGIPEDKKFILNVSNFFPGKGQEHLHHILQQLHIKRNDIFGCFISSKVNFAMAENLKRRHDMMLKRAKFPSVSLRDISRADTIQAFFEADAFAFPSQTEVAPLVVLECMAAGLPYASLNVGNVPSLTGGLVTESKTVKQGKLQYSSPVYSDFINNLNRILSDDDLHSSLSHEGKQRILDIHDWSKVKEQYRNVFES